MKWNPMKLWRQEQNKNEETVNPAPAKKTQLSVLQPIAVPRKSLGGELQEQDACF